MEKIFYPKRIAAIKTVEYTPLGSELRKQTSLAEKQYQELGKVFEPNKKEEDKIKSKRRCAMSSLFYGDDDHHHSSSYEFSSYHRKKMKQKTKEVVVCQIYSTVMMMYINIIDHHMNF